MTRPKPVILIILDGWGERAPSPDNAIALAKTPHWDRLMREFPHGVIHASELQVGLPEGQMGNSEVGHMNIGAGRVVMQDLPRIDQAVRDGSLAANPRLLAFIDTLKKSGGACHLMGLLSPGGVHAHIDHIIALALIVSSHGIQVFIHAFLDGRDTPPRSALQYIEYFRKKTESAGHLIQFGTLMGRYYAMDRDKRWERVRLAYEAMVENGGDVTVGAENVVGLFYDTHGKGDEFVHPSILGDNENRFEQMNDGDGLLMANFRADRAREILTVLLDPGFDGFPRKRVVKFAATLGMVEYSDALNPFIPALFPPEKLTDILGEVVSNAGLTQLRIAETEKYAHVTFFFNGGREAEFPGESRILIPSPKVATYDLKPEMSAFEVTDALLKAIEAEQFDLIVVNFANTDMVGHTGDLQAAMKAVEAVDACVGKITDAALAKGGALLITADHGNVEAMFDNATHQPHTAHTLSLVPALLIAEKWRGKRIPIREGKLADVAPTILHMLQLPKPKAMTGESLLKDTPHA